MKISLALLTNMPFLWEGKMVKKWSQYNRIVG